MKPPTLCLLLDGMCRSALGHAVVWITASVICVGAHRASFETGVAVGRSGTHLAFRPLEFPLHASVAAWLHWLCWP